MKVFKYPFLILAKNAKKHLLKTVKFGTFPELAQFKCVKKYNVAINRR